MEGNDGGEEGKKVVNRARLKTQVGGAFGNLMEWYDFSLFGAFAVVIGDLFFPTDDPVAALLSGFAVFAIGFLVRPLGGALFGLFSDRTGRKRALQLSICLMVVPTMLVGLLPTYDQVGLLAPALLVLLRIVQGMAVGGEFATSVTFIGEHAPPARRGLFLSSTNIFATGGSLLATGVAAVTTSVFADALYGGGWRVPFLLALLLGLLGLYLRSGLEEPESFKEMQSAGQLSETPLREALRGYRRPILVGIAIGWLPAASFYMMAVYLNGFLYTEGGLSLSQGLGVQTFGLFIAMLLTIPSGWLADRVGRKPLVAGYGLAGFAMAYLLFSIFSGGWEPGDIAAQALFAALVGVTLGVFPPALLELYPARVRNSAMALSVNVVYGLIGGTTPLIATFLVSTLDSPLAPALYLAVSGLISFAAAFKLKETAGKPLQS